MAFVDFKSDKKDCPRIFEKLTDLHLKGNKYRGDSVLPSLLAGSPNLVKLSVHVKSLTGNSGRRVLSDCVLSDLLGPAVLQRLEEISLGLVESHQGRYIQHSQWLSITGPFRAWKPTILMT